MNTFIRYSFIISLSCASFVVASSNKENQFQAIIDSVRPCRLSPQSSTFYNKLRFENDPLDQAQAAQEAQKRRDSYQDLQIQREIKARTAAQEKLLEEAALGCEKILAAMAIKHKCSQAGNYVVTPQPIRATRSYKNLEFLQDEFQDEEASY